MNRKTMWVWVLAIVSAIGVEAAAAKFNSKLMDRDLRIMEGILGEILGDGDSSPVIWGYSESTRVLGMYYDGYGVLFLAEDGLFPHRIRVARKVGRQGDMWTTTDDDVVEVALDPATSEDVVGLRKDRIVEFLSSYAGAIRQLKPDDRVSIRLSADPGGSWTHRGLFPDLNVRAFSPGASCTI